MIIYEEEAKVVELNEGESVIINRGIWHIHSNPYDEASLTYWDFDGDITKIIESIRKGT